MRDRRSIDRLRRGDVDALQQVYDRYKDDLLTVAMSLLNDRHAAEDCAHDVFVHFAADPADLRDKEPQRLSPALRGEPGEESAQETPVAARVAWRRTGLH